MATSPLYDGNIGGRSDRSIARGHGTRALGPSDSSDSGSDLVGADGLVDDAGEGIDEIKVPTPDVPKDADDIRTDRIETIRPDED